MSEPAPIEDPVLAFPSDMRVRSIGRWTFTMNNDEHGSVWIWLRTPHSCVAFDMSPDEAEHFSAGLRGSADRGRSIAAAKSVVQVVPAAMDDLIPKKRRSKKA